MRYDYGDVFDTMAFFAGQPNIREFGRDDLAQQIGARGRHFALHRMRYIQFSIRGILLTYLQVGRHAVVHAADAARSESLTSARGVRR